MTHKELAEYYPLRREIDMNKARLAAATESDAVFNTPLENIIRRGVEQQKRILEYINAIPDSYTRQIFTLKFCEGLKWADIANIVGGGILPQSLRQCVYRYLKAHP